MTNVSSFLRAVRNYSIRELQDVSEELDMGIDFITLGKQRIVDAILKSSKDYQAGVVIRAAKPKAPDEIGACLDALDRKDIGFVRECLKLPPPAPPKPPAPPAPKEKKKPPPKKEPPTEEQIQAIRQKTRGSIVEAAKSGTFGASMEKAKVEGAAEKEAAEESKVDAVRKESKESEVPAVEPVEEAVKVSEAEAAELPGMVQDP
jgi:type IV secretory pathway VirB10-like protein